MDYIPDYNELYDEYEAEQEALAERNRKKVCGEVAIFPKCSACGEEITDEYLYDLDGEILCKECMEWNYRKPTENYIKWEKIYG